MRLDHTFYLNSPWAVVVAPATGFGGFRGKILVGQFGSGAILVFDPSTGRFNGIMFDPNLLYSQINGLWGLGFGNGGSAGPTNTLFFTAGVFGGSQDYLDRSWRCPASPNPLRSDRNSSEPISRRANAPSFFLCRERLTRSVLHGLKEIVVEISLSHATGGTLMRACGNPN